MVGERTKGLHSLGERSFSRQWWKQNNMPRAAIIPAPNQPIELRQFPHPIIEPGAVLLKTLAAEVCGTDVHLWHGKLAGVPYPIIPGHVNVGEVLAAGGDVRD